MKLSTVKTGRQSRHLVDRNVDGSIDLLGPDPADVFVGCETVGRLEPSGEVLGCHEVSEVGP